MGGPLKALGEQMSSPIKAKHSVLRTETSILDIHRALLRFIAGEGAIADELFRAERSIVESMMHESQGKIYPFTERRPALPGDPSARINIQIDGFGNQAKVIGAYFNGGVIEILLEVDGENVWEQIRIERGVAEVRRYCKIFLTIKNGKPSSVDVVQSVISVRVKEGRGPNPDPFQAILSELLT